MTKEDSLWKELKDDWPGREFSGRAGFWCSSETKRKMLGNSVDWKSMNSYNVEVISMHNGEHCLCNSYFVLITGDKKLHRNSFKIYKKHLEEELKNETLIRVK